MSYNINEIYKLLQENQWEQILTFEKEHRKSIINDNGSLHFFNTIFFPQVFNYLEKVDKTYSHIIIKNIYFHFLHIKNNPYSIEDKLFEELAKNYISSLININKEKEAYSIAKKWEKLAIAKEFINLYDEKNLKEINHEQDISLQLKVNNPEQYKSQIPLFKSNQEIEFFYALREYFPNHWIYPNVALSCIINFDEVKHLLSKEEASYFFTAIIDCVTFRQEDNNFYPEVCFELDSIFHDEKKQNTKDQLKNKILTKSGHLIYRIRSTENKSLKREELKQLIKEQLSG